MPNLTIPIRRQFLTHSSPILDGFEVLFQFPPSLIWTHSSLIPNDSHSSSILDGFEVLFQLPLSPIRIHSSLILNDSNLFVADLDPSGLSKRHNCFHQKMVEHSKIETGPSQYGVKDRTKAFKPQRVHPLWYQLKVQIVWNTQWTFRHPN